MQHITIRDGRAKIRGYKARIVAEWVVKGASIEWILENFDLTRAEVHAALAYYYDNQAFFEQRESEQAALMDYLAQESRERRAKMEARLREIQGENITEEE